MSHHDILIFMCGSLAGTVALLVMQMVRSFGRRDVEGELVAALVELRAICETDPNRDLWCEEFEERLRRADLAIALATAEAQS